MLIPLLIFRCFYPSSALQFVYKDSDLMLIVEHWVQFALHCTALHWTTLSLSLSLSLTVTARVGRRPGLVGPDMVYAAVRQCTVTLTFYTLTLSFILIDKARTKTKDCGRYIFIKIIS